MEVRYDAGGGRRGPWAVFQTQMYSQDRAERLRSRSRSSGEREVEKEKGGGVQGQGPPVWQLDMDAVSQLPTEEAARLVEMEKERLRIETEEWRRQQQEELEWNTYIEPY